ncbi:MAG TPA: hypothetical protein VF228_04460 [Iamia sp.]
MSRDGRATAELVAEHAERLSRGDLEGCGEDANRILDRVHRGESVEVLRPLFDAGDVECTKSLTFILSELGLRSIGTMGWLNVLLDYPDEYVRHYAIIAVQHSGSLEDDEVVAKAISKIGDSRPVALAVTRFLALGSLRQIATAVPLLDGDLGEAVAWLAGEDFGEWGRFSSHGGVVPLVAVAAAFRLRALGDPAPLDALMEDDRELVGDAARFVARFQPLPQAGRDILHRIARDSAGD